jgi:Family of unknown function (DUF6152)
VTGKIVIINNRDQQEGAMRRKLVGVVLGAGLVVAAAAPLWAHHAFAAEFDANKPIKFKATLQRMEWVNPHTWLHVAVKQPDGSVQEWAIEAGNPNALFRRGFTKTTLQPGLEIVVDGYAAKDGSHRANGRDLTLPDGRTMFLGSSGTGAPLDGKDATEKK